MKKLVKIGSVEAALNKSLKEVEVPINEAWALPVMRRYARQLDRAERMMAYALDFEETLAENDIVLRKDMQMRFDRMKDMLDAQNTIATIAPKYLQMMEKYGMTPLLVKPTTNNEEVGGDSTGTEQRAEEVDELAELRNRRGRDTRASG